MDIFRLMGRIAIDASDAEGDINKVTKHAQSAGQRINASFNKIGKAFTATTKGIGQMGNALIQVGETTERVGRSIARGISIGGAAVSTAAVTIGKSALDIRSSIEQGMGGAEAVFQEYAHHIKSSSKDAWKTAGLSVEEYLSTANKMGSLFKGAGFSEVQAATYTTQAMQRAADVASIMGIDISTAMESIAGAAKGNFTMMDNLGVAMNETTLEAYRLEKGIGKTVSKMTTSEKVGLAMQMFLDRTADYAGNYAKENETAAGSLQTLKAAWSNFLGNVGTFEDLEKSAFGYLRIAAKTMGLEGFEPMITGAQEVVEEVAEILSMEGLDGRSKFAKIRRYLLDKFGTLADSLGKRIVHGVANASDLISETLSDINVNLPQYMSVGVDILNSIRAGIKNAAAQLQNSAAIVAPDVITGWFGLKTDFIAIGLDIIGSIAEGISNDLALGNESKIATSLKEGLQNVLSSLSITIPKLTNLASQIIDSIANALSDPLASGEEGKINAAVQEVLYKILDGMEIVLPNLVNLATKIIDGIAEALKNGDPKAAAEKAGTILEKMTAELGAWVDGGGVTNFAEAASPYLAALGEKLVELAPTVLATYIQGIWDGLTGILGGVTSFFSDEDAQALNKLKSSLDSITDSFGATAEAVESAETAYDTSMEDLEARMALAEEHLSTIAALEKKVMLSSEDQAAWKNAVLSLVNLYPQLGALVDAETGKFNTSTDAIRANITALQDLARQKALDKLVEDYQSAYTELVSDQVAAKVVLNNAYKEKDERTQVVEMLEKHLDEKNPVFNATETALLKKYYSRFDEGFKEKLDGSSGAWGIGNINSARDEIKGERNVLARDIKELEEGYKETKNELEELSKTIQEEIEAFNSLYPEKAKSWAENVIPELELEMKVSLPDEDATVEEIEAWLENVDPELIKSMEIELPPANATAAEMLAWWQRVRPNLSANVQVNVPNISGLAGLGSYISTPTLGGRNSLAVPKISAFATGLDYVPRDNFFARLHYGEAVLTRSEADVWRSGGNTGKMEAQLSQMNSLLQRIVQNTGIDRAVMLDTGAMVGQLAPRMNAQLGAQHRRSTRG